MKAIVHGITIIMTAMALSFSQAALADSTEQVAKIDNVGFMSVIDKPKNCSIPKLQLQKKQFKQNNLTVYLTVQNSRDGSHWVIGQRKFLKDPKSTKYSPEYANFAPVTSATIACDNESLVSGL